MKKILCRSRSSLRVALALSVLTLAGCSVSGEQAAAAATACEQYGGVNEIDLTADYFFRVYCKDGTQVIGDVP